jgi:hypothetical protein
MHVPLIVVVGRTADPCGAIFLVWERVFFGPIGKIFEKGFVFEGIWGTGKFR